MQRGMCSLMQPCPGAIQQTLLCVTASPGQPQIPHAPYGHYTVSLRESADAIPYTEREGKKASHRGALLSPPVR